MTRNLESGASTWRRLCRSSAGLWPGEQKKTAGPTFFRPRAPAKFERCGDVQCRAREAAVDSDARRPSIRTDRRASRRIVDRVVRSSRGLSRRRGRAHEPATIRLARVGVDDDHLADGTFRVFLHHDEPAGFPHRLLDRFAIPHPGARIDRNNRSSRCSRLSPEFRDGLEGFFDGVAPATIVTSRPVVTTRT